MRLTSEVFVSGDVETDEGYARTEKMSIVRIPCWHEQVIEHRR